MVIERWLGEAGSAPGPHEVKVVRCDLDGGGPPEQHLLNCIPDGERAHAEGFRNPSDRVRFVTARALLRTLLAPELSCEAREIRFEVGDHGKPRLHSSHPQDLRFNLSHSGRRVVIALSWQAEVGVDVEQRSSRRNLSAVAARFFSSDEAHQVLTRRSEAERELAFHTCWCRKEAFVKALGTGISFPLASFTVDADPAGSGDLLWIANRADERKRWGWHPLDAGEGYVGALVVEGHGRVVRTHTLPGPSLDSTPGD